MTSSKIQTDELDLTADISAEEWRDLSLLPGLVILAGGVLGKRYQLEAEETGLGREIENSISLTHGSVSRKHAEIHHRDGEFFIRDLASRNGTFVNGTRVEDEARIGIGDTIKLGAAVMKMVQGGDTEDRFHEEIYRRTILDELTGLSNRRHLSEFLDREIARARRHRRPLTVVIFDIDHFKEVNDEHGHDVGDTVLQSVAETITQTVRRDELAARYGGEEFVVVLPETDTDGGLKFAERVASAVRESTFAVASGKIVLTLSGGIAEYERGQTSEDLIRVADQRLYAAKKKGRDRIVGSG